jgi:hypothetical protein
MAMRRDRDVSVRTATDYPFTEITSASWLNRTQSERANILLSTLAETGHAKRICAFVNLIKREMMRPRNNMKRHWLDLESVIAVAAGVTVIYLTSIVLVLPIELVFGLYFSSIAAMGWMAVRILKDPYSTEWSPIEGSASQPRLSKYDLFQLPQFYCASCPYSPFPEFA